MNDPETGRQLDCFRKSIIRYETMKRQIAAYVFAHAFREEQ